MKTHPLTLAACATVALTATLLGSSSCADLLSRPGEGKGTLIIELPSGFSASGSMDDMPATRSFQAPKAEDFLLRVADASGKIIYEGPYGSSPEKFSLDAGNYSVSAESCDFDEPRFDAPQFGDSKVVAVAAGQTACVLLECSQTNCGLQLEADAAFRSAFPTSDILLKSLSGSLLWSYGEKRTAYFKPGSVSIILNGSNETLCTRTLSVAQMLTLKLSATADVQGEQGSGEGISMSIDTTRTWIDDKFVLGGSNPGSSASLAYTVSQARMHLGEQDVWVCGYIVGVATNTSKFQQEGPFSRETNIVLGLRSGTTDPEFMLSVELPKGDIRDALNLATNPNNLGKRVCIRGTLANAYYGIPGLKSPSDYQF